MSSGVLAREVEPASSPTYGALLRDGSPPAGFSTLITVAPSAPRSCVAYGPGERDRHVDDGDALERASEAPAATATYLRSPNTDVVGFGAWPSTASGCASAGSTPTRAGGSTSRSPSAGPRRPRPGLYRKLGLLDGGTRRLPAPARRGRLPPRARASTTRSRCGSASRRSGGRRSVRLGGRPRRRGRDHGGAHDRPRRRRRPADADRRAHAGAADSSIKEPDTLAPRRTRRATGIPTPPGGRSRPDQAPDAEPRVRGGAGAVPGRPRRRRARRLLGRPRARLARRGRARHGTFSNVVPFFDTRRPPLECDPPEHTRLPAAAQPLLLARAAGSARGAAPAVRGRDARPARRGRARRLRGGVQPPVPDARALPAARAARTTTGA